MSINYKKGDNIELLKTSDNNTPTTTINSPSPSKPLHLKFHTLSDDHNNNKKKRKRVKEYVDVSTTVLGPAPVPEVEKWFAVGEKVEVFYEGGWRKGEVKEVVVGDGDRKYMVVVGGDGMVEVVVDGMRVRGLSDWVQDNDGPKEKPSKMVLLSKEGTKLRIKCSPRTPKTITFETGTPVEVRSNEEGYHGSWFTAIVVGSADKDDKLMVKYDTLTTDDETQALVEIADVSNVRPIPPMNNRIDRFKMLEKVNAWFNDGWWVGIVSKVLAGFKYVVYFWTTNEELEFQHSKLRPHQDLINEKWVPSFLRLKLDDEHRLEKVELRTGGRSLMVGLLCGLKVEIAHGVEGYLSTWYPAVILGPAHNGKYLVQYQSRTTNSGRELLKEEVNALCIRPCPPIMQRAHQFQQNDGVDVWDANCWRIGQICSTMKESKYAVYFVATNTVLEFHHAELRPHQDFIDGEWLLATKDSS